jgi:O-antigen/teichoic acid export membrane protein
MAVSLNIDIIGLFFLRSPVYRDGLSVVPVLLMANLFLGIYYNLSVWFKLTDKTYFGTIISTGGALITIILNILFIPHFGYAGSSWVTLICYFLISMASYLIGQRYYPIPYKVLKAFIFIILSSLLVLIGNERVSQSMIVQKLFQFTLILVFIGLVYIFEKKQIRSYLNKSV